MKMYQNLENQKRMCSSTSLTWLLSGLIPVEHSPQKTAVAYYLVPTREMRDKFLDELKIGGWAENSTPVMVRVILSYWLTNLLRPHL